MKDNYVTVPVYIGADVANGATFTVGYPAGYTAGDFSGAAGHHIMLNGTRLSQPQRITLAFGASVVTVTNGTGDVIPAGQKGVMQLEIRGKNADLIVDPPNSKSMTHVAATALTGLLVDFGSPKALDADGLYAAVAVGAVALSFTVADMVVATANGGILDVARNLTVQGGGGGANQVCTFSGFDRYDVPVKETITASGATIVQGVKAFNKVTGFTIAAAGAAAQTLNVGWGDYLGLPIRIKDELQVIAEQQADVLKRRELFRLNFQHTEAELDAAQVRYIAPGFAGKVIDAGIALENVVTTGGALTYTVGATTIVGLTNTIADGAVAGVFYQDTPTNDGTEYFLATDYLTVVPAAAINASAPVTEWITVLKTDGKLTLGLAKNTKATATTTDVRGLYKPNTATDGVTSFGLHILASEVYDIGNYQYNG